MSRHQPNQTLLLRRQHDEPVPPGRLYCWLPPAEKKTFIEKRTVGFALRCGISGMNNIIKEMIGYLHDT